MRDFFKGVRKHIDSMDAGHLREQYRLVSDELARSEMLLHVLRDGIVVVDAKGEVLRANPAAKTLFGMDPENFLPTLGLTPGRASKREIEVTYPETRQLEIQTLPLGDDTVVIAHDVTAEKARTAEEIESGATRSICDLAAGVAHEIGNPLNAIALNVQLIERDPTDREAIEICKQQIGRLDGIIRGFLSALRPKKPNLQPGTVVDPLTSCLAAMKRQFEERGVKVTVDIASALPTVALDRDQIEQVFFNLVKNALEAMKGGSSLAITLNSDDRDVIIRVRDTGVGMTSEQVAHLFEPYRTTKEKGTGLGLMVTQRIIREHGGTVGVESVPNVGTTFTLRLPRLERRIRALK